MEHPFATFDVHQGLNLGFDPAVESFPRGQAQEPTEPAEPVEPAEPAEPVEPAEPEKPAEPSEASDGRGIPATDPRFWIGKNMGMARTLLGGFQPSGSLVVFLLFSLVWRGHATGTSALDFLGEL